MSRPLNINSKKALINYIENTVGELPFVEECWEIALDETRVRNEQVAENNRFNPVKRQRVATSKVYFELLAQPRFKAMAEGEYRRRKGILEPEDEKEKEKEKEKPKIPVHFEDYIDDVESEQGKFILTLLNKYYVELYDKEIVKFIISRIKSYYGEYELNSASDEYLVITVISDEVVLREFNQKRARGEEVDIKEMKSIRDSYLSSLDGLKALKKFNQDNKDKENLFSIWTEKLVKDGSVNKIHKVYDKDQIDFIMENNIEAIRRSFSG